MKNIRPLLLRGLLLTSVASLSACGGGGGGSGDSSAAAGGNQVPDPILHTVPPSAVTWTECAKENEICKFTGTREVRYGANGQYKKKIATGWIECSDAAFGDPLADGSKVCEYSAPVSTQTTEPKPEPQPQPQPGQCNDAINTCYGLTEAKVAKYLGNKEAAASYTFDDGYASSTKIASIFEKKGLRATFYIVAGNVAEADWPVWIGMAQNGHEIGNHSMTHTYDMSDPSLSDQILDNEINGALRLIKQKLGTKPLTFAFPWHQYTEHALQMAESSHLWVRKLDIGESNYRFVFFDQDHAATLDEALTNANNDLKATVNEGGWMVAGGHGVDGDGWSPVTSQFLIDHLNYASKFSSKLWIDTYLNVARYRACRDQVKPVVSIDSSSTATIRLEGKYDPVACTAPLTVTMPIKTSDSGSVNIVAHTEEGEDVPVQAVDQTLMLDMRPGDTVALKVKR